MRLVPETNALSPELRGLFALNITERRIISKPAPGSKQGTRIKAIVSEMAQIRQENQTQRPQRAQRKTTMKAQFIIHEIFDVVSVILAIYQPTKCFV